MDTDKMKLLAALTQQVTDLIVEAWAKVCNESDAQHVSESKNAGNVIATGNEIQSNEEVKQNGSVVKKRKRSGTLDFYTPHMWRVKILDCIMKGTPNHNYSAQELIDIFGIKGQRDACARVTQFLNDLRDAHPDCMDKDGKRGNYSYTFNPAKKFVDWVNIGNKVIWNIDKCGVEEFKDNNLKADPKWQEIRTAILREYGDLSKSDKAFLTKLAGSYIAHKKGMQPEVQDKDCIN